MDVKYDMVLLYMHYIFSIISTNFWHHGNYICKFNKKKYYKDFLSSSQVLWWSATRMQSMQQTYLFQIPRTLFVSLDDFSHFLSFLARMNTVVIETQTFTMKSTRCHTCHCNYLLVFQQCARTLHIQIFL